MQTVQNTSEIPQLQFLDKVDDTRCVQRQVLGLTVEKTAEFPQLHCSDKVGDVPVVQVVVGVSLEGATDSVHRQSSWTFQLYRDGYAFSAGDGDECFSRIFRIFRALLGCLGVERQFSSPR